MKRNTFLRHVLCGVLCLVLTVATLPIFSHAAEEKTVEQIKEEMTEEMAVALRNAMIGRVPSLTKTYFTDQLLFPENVLSDQNAFNAVVNSLFQDIYNRAIAHTGAGRQGDYLRWHIARWEQGLSLTYETNGPWSGNYAYTITFDVEYYTTEDQEEALTTKLQQVLPGLQLQGKSDYEKVKAIYDYICTHVEYDYANLNDPNHKLKYSAYAALVNGKAVCQGYSNLFYRMANEAGVDTRIVTGVSNGQAHAWNVVKLDGLYYNLDCTWDSSPGEYRYFLRCDANMFDHQKDTEFLTVYPMSPTDYVIPKDPEPSTEPTTEPTTAPATNPTTEPTTAPATNPTTAPSKEPTEAPTTAPATVPASKPATEPTKAPATEPTKAPATVPAVQDNTTAPTVQTQVPATGSAPTGTSQPSTGGTSSSQTTSAGDTHPSSPDATKDDSQGSPVILIVCGAAVLAVAAGGGALLARKRKS